MVRTSLANVEASVSRHECSVWTAWRVVGFSKSARPQIRRRTRTGKAAKAWHFVSFRLPSKSPNLLVHTLSCPLLSRPLTVIHSFPCLCYLLPQSTSSYLSVVAARWAVPSLAAIAFCRHHDKPSPFIPPRAPRVHSTKSPELIQSH
jgi:hypothetical protein